MRVYLISGIMSDERVFCRLKFPEGYEPVYLRFIPPARKQPIKEYALRIVDHIDTSAPFVLLGFSFGGILATEIAKLTNPALTIIVASVTTDQELPPYFRLFRRSGIYRIAHPVLLKTSAIVKNLVAKRRPEDRISIIRQVITTENRFVSWVVHGVLHWKNEIRPADTIKIHGTKDEVFPIKYVQANFVLEEGHLLPLKKADELNAIISKLLKGVR
jgi:pimeloyl-ACP methyl ester carboxylesterase